MSAPDALRDAVERVRREAERDYPAVAARTELDALYARDLARRGRIAALFDQLAGLDPAARRDAGRRLNELKQQVTALHAAAAARLDAARPATAAIDPTLPGRPHWVARPHVLSQLIDEICDIFTGLGFGIADGPEIELDRYNFEALNFPADHPARDLQDTFYVDDAVLLRTQTSPMQVRILERQPPPVRVIVPGRVFRNEALDATHAAEFNQVEGLYVDERVSMVDLKATVTYFLRRLFGPKTQARFKPHFFPFTEPSVDVDMWFESGGKSGWIEIMGAGMVHPNVFRAAGVDPEAYTGFAFGLGVERVAMLRHGIHDLRAFLENDVRFLSQF
jgi:phenylalanyl-tRNA synthetase alpha chain